MCSTSDPLDFKSKTYLRKATLEKEVLFLPFSIRNFLTELGYYMVAMTFAVEIFGPNLSFHSRNINLLLFEILKPINNLNLEFIWHCGERYGYVYYNKTINSRSVSFEG